MSDEESIKQNCFLVGYALEQRQCDLQYSKQTQKISEFCSQANYNLIFTELEVGVTKNICRAGLWRVTRALVCYQCEPDFMPVSFDVDAWVQRAMMPCRCAEPLSVDGLVVTSINSICSEPVVGSTYALNLARARKHLFVIDKLRCVSCCNPAADPLLGGKTILR